MLLAICLSQILPTDFSEEPFFLYPIRIGRNQKDNLKKSEFEKHVYLYDCIKMYFVIFMNFFDILFRISRIRDYAFSETTRKKRFSFGEREKPWREILENSVLTNMFFCGGAAGLRE
uniref:Uncharacterized protein n=1 Tax=Candidatus Kentrum sp. SD TaxID=2126332 RepID=A0A450YV40_9GAMM|nr:MAG: hypothetical protein BECKSD772F_GA0070984_12234 [Candidatus Kentron sp. SD]VFK49828.1 MAG: hypothetical protein BECKSD772E_GA0070983_12503 [Candidatus Kentron sp. SD]